MLDLPHDPGHAEIVARDADQPGTYTVLLNMCPCGAVVGECDCRQNPARPTAGRYRVEFADIPHARRVPDLVITVADDGELAVRVYRYLRPFYNNPDIEVSLSTWTRAGRVMAHGVPVGQLTVTRMPKRGMSSRSARTRRNRSALRRPPAVEHEAPPARPATT